MNVVEFRTFPTVEAADHAVEELIAQGIPAENISVVRVEGELASPDETPTAEADLNPAQSDYPRDEAAVTPVLSSRPPNLVDDPVLRTTHVGDRMASALDPVTPDATTISQAEGNPTPPAEEVAPASPEEPETGAKPLIKRVGAGLGLGALAAGATLAVPGFGLVLGSGILVGAVATMVKSSSDQEDRHAQARKLFLEAGADEGQATHLAERWVAGETVIRIERPELSTATR